MATNPESIRAKLYNISKEEKEIAFQELLNRYGAEQFLARLSVSPHAGSFIFKGGSLLAYLIDSERKTRDLDFSIRQVSNKVEDALSVVQTILTISMDDGLTWDSPEGVPLNHPEMDYPGVRIKCLFRLGKAQGHVRMDLAIGDIVEAKKVSLERIRYRGQPLIGPDFKILAYPPETIFSEKLQIAIKRGGQNTRMKDYYDLFKMSQLGSLDSSLCKQSIEKTFSKRKTDKMTLISFDDEILERLQIYWSAFIRKMKITDAPDLLKDVVKIINRRLEAVYKNG
ncbi:MAG: nucleotidyl transferase AbiEii/AbiGii toxin family protein [bacterium]